jgi:hypothetical protein
MSAGRQAEGFEIAGHFVEVELGLATFHATISGFALE